PSTAAIPTGDASWPRWGVPAWSWTSTAWTCSSARSGWRSAAGPATTTRRSRAAPSSRIRSASGPGSGRDRPWAGCGPATSRAATWTSTPTTGADMDGTRSPASGLDPEILRYYAAGPESERLRQGAFQLERARTEELLLRHLPPPHARVLDVGGGSGPYACWLAERGYEVTLLDPVPL